MRRVMILFCCFLFVYNHNFNAKPIEINNNQTNVKSIEKRIKNQENIVFSSEDVLFFYYKQVLDGKTLNEEKFVSFDTFCKLYYENDIDISLYASLWNDINHEDYDIINFDALTSKINRSLEVEKYILDSHTYDVTPTSVFKRQPIMKFDYYSLLYPGDIVFETNTTLTLGHMAVITNLSKQSAEYGTYCETIESVKGPGVVYGFLDDERIARFGVKILRVYQSGRFWDNAYNFLIDQVGKGYSLEYWHGHTDGETTQKWYCSELVWAAYYNAGIDIVTMNGIGYGEEGNSASPIPSQIYLSDFTSEIQFNEIFLDLSILKKNGNVWTIRVTNPNKFDVTVQYNAKMCFLDDCLKWDDVLNDIENENILRYSYNDIEIRENWFADAITTRFVENGFSYCTYANSLVANTKNMVLRTAILFND